MTAAALVVAVALILVNQKPVPSTGAHLVTPPVAYAPGITSGESLGRADAPVVMAVWADFQCPVCGRLVREQFGSLKREFVDAGILRIEARDIAFLGLGTPDESLELAVGARCAAAQSRYWQFHDFVYWNQHRENRGDYSADFISSVARAAGVDMAAWQDCVAGTEARAAIRQATAEAFAAGINSTPTISLNGGTPVAGLPDAIRLAGQIRVLATAVPTSPAVPASAAP